MKIALAQMEVIPGDPDRNLATMLSMIGQARDEGADLVAFPELCVSGYLLSDLWTNEEFCRRLMTYNDAIAEASREIAIAYGNIYLDETINQRWGDENAHPNKDGRKRKYNAVYVFQHGKPVARPEVDGILPVGVQPKTLLPNYRIFDDTRYFFSLQDIAVDSGKALESLAQPFPLTCHGAIHKIGFEICEDLWIRDYRRLGKPLNMSNLLVHNGAEVLVNISASPWNDDKNSSRDRRILFLKEEAGSMFVPFLYVNKAGTENNGKNIITFDGGTTVYNAEGKPVQMAAARKQDIIYCDITKLASAPIVERKEPPVIEQKFDAIISGIRHLQNFVPGPLRLVVGLSGGIDSAIVASLLTVACGKENVVAINMPSRYNSNLTKDNAQVIANNLGIPYHIIPVEELAEDNRRLFSDLDRVYGKSASLLGLSDENIQAKLRGTAILSNFAGRYGYLMSANGNKLEIALGYATLYGDVNGSVAAIGDLTKAEVYEMGRFLNEHVFRREVIPSILFPDALFRFRKDQILPSPELKEAQINPMKFGYHCALITAATNYLRKTPSDIMQWYVDGVLEQNLHIPNGLIERWGLDKPDVFIDDLQWFFSTIQKNYFKRVQAPPIIITSKSAFGYDLRESMIPGIVPMDHGLMKKVLSMDRYKILTNGG